MTRFMRTSFFVVGMMFLVNGCIPTDQQQKQQQNAMSVEQKLLKDQITLLHEMAESFEKATTKEEMVKMRQTLAAQSEQLGKSMEEFNARPSQTKLVAEAALKSQLEEARGRYQRAKSMERK